MIASSGMRPRLSLTVSSPSLAARLEQVRRSSMEEAMLGFQLTIRLSICSVMLSSEPNVSKFTRNTRVVGTRLAQSFGACLKSLRAASITCSWSRQGRCRPRSLAWVGGRSSPSRYFRLRRRTDRRHRTRAPTRLPQAASRASRGPLRSEDRLASNRSRHLPRCRARALRRPR